MEPRDPATDCSLPDDMTAVHHDAPAIIHALFAPTGLAGAIPLAMVAWDPRLHIIAWNREAAAMLGWSAKEAVGKTAAELLPDCAGAERIVAESLPAHITLRHVTRDGRKIVCEWDISLLRKADGSLLAAVFAGRDVTRQQQAVRERERMFAIAAAANAARDLDEILLIVRNAIIEVEGFERAGVWLVDNGLLYGTWGTDELGQLRDEHDIVGRPEDFPLGMRVVARGERSYYLEKNALVAYPGMVERRITERYDYATVGMVTQGKLIGIISADNVLSGRSLSEDDVQALLPFSEQAAMVIANARLLEERRRHLDRQRRLASLAAAISASTALNDVLRMVRDAIVEVGGFDRASVCLYDRETDRLLGTWGTSRQGELEDESDQSFSVAEDTVEIQRVVRGELAYALIANYTAQYHPSPDHTMYGVRAHAVVPLRVGEDVVGIVFVDNLLRQTPITDEDIEALLPFTEQAAVAIQNARLFAELRQTQEALLRSEKMRAVGELASGVAHNVNNVLAAILGYAELIQEAENVSAELAHFARTIERAALDGAEIVRRVQQFARWKNETSPTVFDLAAVASEAIEMARPAWRNQAAGRGVKIEVKTRLQPGLLARGEASEIREVLVNLLRNAVDAMPEGGMLTVCCHDEDRQGVVSVADTGVGMDEMTRQRVFEPFFTTRSGRGMGLGLSVAWGIMERHKGRIEVLSAPGHGSQFQIRLPLADESEVTASAPEEGNTLEGTRILLVEDEELVAEGVARMLLARGAEVAFVQSAYEALDWLTASAADCDVVISDHGMVGMTGLELLAVIRQRYPSLRRILLSGWGTNLPGAHDASAAEQILAKPVRLADLASAVSGNRR
jgi:PAS domain S-box-containing protein